MDASRLRWGVFAARPSTPLGDTVALSAAFLAFSTLFLAALAIGARRLAGALVEPLEPLALLAAGFSAVAISVAGGLLWRIGRSADLPFWCEPAARWLPRAALLIMGLAVFVPGSSWLVACLLVGIAVAGQWAVAPRRRRSMRRHATKDQTNLPDKPTGQIEPFAHVEPFDHATQKSRPPRLELDESDAAVEQQLVRSVSAAGVDKLVGQVRARFQDGQRTAWAHVAFCPPFSTTPQLVHRPVAGASARITVGTLLPYGVRFDLKLARTSEGPQAVVVEFTATAKASGATPGESPAPKNSGEVLVDGSSGLAIG